MDIQQILNMGAKAFQSRLGGEPAGALRTLGGAGGVMGMAGKLFGR